MSVQSEAKSFKVITDYTTICEMSELALGVKYTIVNARKILT